MKIELLTCFYKRKEITEIYLEGFKRLQKDFDIDYTFVASEVEDSAFIREQGYNCLTFKNEPLSDKFNFGLNQALKKNWDYLLIMGSDDLLSNEGLGLLLDNSYSYKGFGDIQFYNSMSKEAIHFKYDKDRLIGAGRLVSREAVERVVFKTGVALRKTQMIGNEVYSVRQEFLLPNSSAKYLDNIGYGKLGKNVVSALWNNGLKSGLDHSSEMSLALNGYTPYKVVSDKCHLIDIKSDVNITQWFNLAKTGKKIEFDTWFLSDKEKELISRL